MQSLESYVIFFDPKKLQNEHPAGVKFLHMLSCGSSDRVCKIVPKNDTDFRGENSYFLADL
jgi:hypothetical protein